MSLNLDSDPIPPGWKNSRWRFSGARLFLKFLGTTAVAFNPLDGRAQESAAADAWIDFAPAKEDFASSPLDLRALNDPTAGSRGWIAAKGADFVFPDTGEAVRFWAVNGPPDRLSGEALSRCARRLAKYGVNLMRMHSAAFDDRGEADMEKVRRTQERIAAMKAAGIYSHLSIYFPLWMRPEADHSWLKGYDGKKHPFAALMFNAEFQARYRSWWRALLLTPDASGRKLVDDPALCGVELSEITIHSGLDNGHIVLVALDGQPIAKSSKMLLQVMSEERTSGFATEDAGNGVKKITSIGKDPWQFKRLDGSVKFKSTRPLRCQPLDFHGYAKGEPETMKTTEGLRLAPDVLYYLITAP